jgi:hypothetical protein
MEQDDAGDSYVAAHGRHRPTTRVRRLSSAAGLQRPNSSRSAQCRSRAPYPAFAADQPLPSQPIAVIETTGRSLPATVAAAMAIVASWQLTQQEAGASTSKWGAICPQCKSQ